MAARPSASSRLRFALGCCWATMVIAREYSPASIPLASVVLMLKGTLGYGWDEPGILARRSFTLFLVAGLRVALFYALMTGMVVRIIKEMPAPFQTRLLQAPQAQPIPPPPPPSLVKPSIELPPAHLPPTQGSSEEGDIEAGGPDIATPRSETPPTAPPHDVIRVPGGPGYGFPTTDDYHPPMAKRLEEQGVTTVRVCVGADGRLTAAPTIDQSSDSARLDEGAPRLATAGSGHYRPATEDGRAVNGCCAFRVRFAL